MRSDLAAGNSTRDLRSLSRQHRTELDELASDTLTAIGRMIEDIRYLRDRTARLARGIDTNRSDVQQQREELELISSLELELPELDDGDCANASILAEIEAQLVNQLRQAQGFERSLADFASVLVSAHRQIETGSDLPDPGSANYLAIKMAELRAREEERQRFARDVHDGPAQAFANAIIGLEFIDRALKSEHDNVIEDSLAEIERIKRTMREGLTEIRRFIFDNRPTMLEDRGLVPTLRHYIQSYQSIFPMVINIEVDEGIGRLEPDLELAAFRVVQESIQNASRHARANQVSVQIVDTGTGNIVVTVSDDGRGFDPDRVDSHAMGGAGLRGMRERVGLLGGVLDIQSQRGSGTTIMLTLPRSNGGVQSSD